MYIYNNIRLPRTQEGTWMSVAKYWELHAPEDLKKKRKTMAQKKAWITKDSWLSTNKNSSISQQQGIVVLLHTLHAGRQFMQYQNQKS